jgi:hypothetical protein
MAVFKAKEREDVVHHVKSDIIIIDELDASSDSSCDTYPRQPHLLRPPPPLTERPR